MEYEDLRIKRFDNWDLFLHMNQFPYIGRSYAWALREDAGKVTDMNSDENIELFNVIIPKWNSAVESLFKHDWPNIACLGNTSPHLHWHLIPRYNSPREFNGIEFIDPNPKGNYAPYPKKKISDDILYEIRDLIKEKI